MSNFHRIIWIDEQIKRNRYPDRKRIADKFEISIRQVARDIEYMKYSLGAPIEFSSFHRGYYYKDGTFTLPAHYLSEKDKSIFKYLAHQYSNYPNRHSGYLADLFARLTDQDREEGKNEIIKGNDKLPVFHLQPGEEKIFHKIAEAINKRLKVQLTYSNAHFRQSKRVFCPYKQFYQNKHNYLVGYCELREEIRVLRLDRIKELKLLDDNYQIVSYFNEKEYEDEVNFKFLKPYIAEIRFDKGFNPDHLKYRYRQTCLDKYEIEFYNSKKLLSNLLSISYTFTILSPSWLKSKMKERLKQLLKKNI